MSVKIYSKKLLAFSFALALNACGGGGNEAGSPTSFRVVPDEYKLTGPTGSCGAGGALRGIVSGGLAPYQIVNLVPLYVRVNVPGDTSRVLTTLVNRDDTFEINFLGGCLDVSAGIVIIDSTNRQVTMKLINEKGA